MSVARICLLYLFVLLLAFAPRPTLAQESQDLGTILVTGLQATEGNLGVEVAQTMSGKQVIFAWFRDKASVLRWYYSDTHRGVQNRFFPDRPPHEPLSHVPDDVGPVLAIAAITPAGPGDAVTEVGIPISQISIEMYAPLPGGLSFGGTFAPAALEVPHMIKGDPGEEHEH